MELPELLSVLLYQDCSAQIPAESIRLNILANANDGNLALKIYLGYFDKTGETPNADQLRAYACQVAKCSENSIAFDLERAADWKGAYPPGSFTLALENTWGEATRLYVSIGYTVAGNIAAGGTPPGWTQYKFEKRMNELYHDEHSYDLPAFSQIWLAEYLAVNPFSGADEEGAEPLDEREFEIAKGIGMEDDAIVNLSLKAIKASDIAPEQLKWLWPDRIPYGKICWFAGKPDCGKSLALLDLVARITTGADFPDVAKNEWGARDVLLAVSEDGLGDTVIPRLNAAGADLSHIRFVQRVIVTSGTSRSARQFQLNNDTSLLKKALKDNPSVVLVALDPITSFFGDVNINIDKDIRPIMDALSAACNASGVSFVSVVHHNKRTDVDALQKVLGASSVVGAARTAWGFSRDPDPENKGEFFMTLVKNNLSKRRTGMKYKIAERTINGITAPYIDWGAETEETANTLLDAERDKKSGLDNKQITLAQEFLPVALANGPKLARDLYDEAEKRGISSDTLKRAKNKMGGVTVYKAKEGWMWSTGKDDPTLPDNTVL